MENYLQIIKKYDCSVVDGRIMTKNGVDTKMNLEGAVKLGQLLSAFGDKHEQQQELLDVFEQELKMRNEVLTNG